MLKVVHLAVIGQLGTPVLLKHCTDAVPPRVAVFWVLAHDPAVNTKLEVAALPTEMVEVSSSTMTSAQVVGIAERPGGPGGPGGPAGPAGPLGPGGPLLGFCAMASCCMARRAKHRAVNLIEVMVPGDGLYVGYDTTKGQSNVT